MNNWWSIYCGVMTGLYDNMYLHSNLTMSWVIQRPLQWGHVQVSQETVSQESFQTVCLQRLLDHNYSVRLSIYDWTHSKTITQLSPGLSWQLLRELRNTVCVSGKHVISIHAIVRTYECVDITVRIASFIGKRSILMDFKRYQHFLCTDLDYKYA